MNTSTKRCQKVSKSSMALVLASRGKVRSYIVDEVIARRFAAAHKAILEAECLDLALADTFKHQSHVMVGSYLK